VPATRPAPAAIGFINSCATFLIVVGTPLVGLTFGLTGHGRLGFVAIAALWALAYIAVRPSQLAVLEDDADRRPRRQSDPAR
jgi:hypothetical protein